jgi:hypothetical protein
MTWNGIIIVPITRRNIIFFPGNLILANAYPDIVSSKSEMRVTDREKITVFL